MTRFHSRNTISFTILILGIILHDVHAARILAVAPFFGKSHSIIVHSVMTHLASKGHDVTIITTNLEKNPPPNYRQIEVDKNVEFAKMSPKDHFALKNFTVFGQVSFPWRISSTVSAHVFKCKSVQDFLKNDKSHFDVVIVEIFYQEVMLMFGLKYKAPTILLGTAGFQRHVGDIMGNPSPYSYIPNELFRQDSEHFSIYQRIFNTAVGLFDKYGRLYYALPKNDVLAKEHFSDVISGPLPTVEELENNVSLALLNTHFSYDKVIPLVPGVVEIGGVHIKPTKKLPENIQKFLDEAVDGAIYFGMGSHVHSSSMEQHKIDAFVRVFGKLKQRVLWKWEDEDNAPKLPNVLTGKWFPQNDILAHPNVKVFISHGGMLSTQESVHHAVPMIGISIFADQHLNVAKLVTKGAGLALDFNEINEETITKVVDHALNCPKIRESIKKLSVQFRDRPLSPLDTATYWVEYVIRHKGTPFLKSTVKNLAWYEYYMLDVAMVIASLLYLIFYIIWLLVTMIRKRRGSHSDKKKIQ